jgi:hypothetical protein
MTMIRRLLPVAAAALCSITLAGSALAQGFGPPPGRSQVSDTNAFADLADSTRSIHANPFVDRGMQTFKAKEAAGPPVVMGPATMLNLGVEVPNGFAFGCWIIPDSAFSVSPDLSSATLTATVTPGVSECPGPPLAAATGARPGLEALSLQPLGGGPPGSFGFIGPVQISLTWTSLGAVLKSRITNNVSCASFISNAQGSDERAFANAAAMLSATIPTFLAPTAKGVPPMPGPPVVLNNASLTSDFGAIDQFSIDQVVSGTLSPACNPFIK